MTTPSGALFNPPSPLIHFSCSLAVPGTRILTRFVGE
jgi:hypothetical protein